MSAVSPAPDLSHEPAADLIAAADGVTTAAERVLVAAKQAVRDAVGDRISADEHQHVTHGVAWLATYVEALRQLAGWARRLEAEGRFGELDGLIL